ncbi:ATP-dependent DNA ligase [Streptomyces sp. NPDC050738]|uniref:ATP-dependent DNA ligase n=1 Tax=Streptomyces sp. NPDC050738 TaxID=3154744 RepID=UPI003414A68D
MAAPFALALAASVDTLPTAKGLAYEPKYDGHRGVIERLDGEPGVVMRSKTGREITSAWMDLAVPALALPPGVILDGEIVVYRDGRLDFSAVQARAAAGHARGLTLVRDSPASFAAFDVLAHPDHDAIRAAPYSERRALLLKVLDPLGPPIQATPMTTDPVEARLWWEVLRTQGIEGLVIKRLDQSYPGGRRAWLKIRHADTVDALVIGFVGTVARPTHLVVRLPDGRTARSRNLTTAVRVAVARALPDLVQPRVVHSEDGEPYTTVTDGLLVEVLAGTTRHVTVTVTRVRQAGAMA